MRAVKKPKPDVSNTHYRGNAPGWYRATLSRDESFVHDLPIDAKRIDFVMFKLSDEAEREAFRQGVEFDEVALVNSQGLWFSDFDERPMIYWGYLVPWAHVIAFAYRPAT